MRQITKVLYLGILGVLILYHSVEAGPKHTEVCTEERDGIATHSASLKFNNEKTYKVYYNKDLLKTLFSIHEIDGRNGVSDTTQSTNWCVTEFKNLADKMYTDQSIELEKLFGKSSTFFDRSKSLYFARGHLTPNADFTTNDDQKTTYEIINAVPQWQCINQANWKTLETNIRTYSENAKLDVYTGTFGVLKLKDNNNVEKEVYLGSNERLRVPLIIYKIVINGQAESGAVFISVNNPHLTSKEFTYCRDQSAQFNWSVWFKRDAKGKLTTNREDWTSADAFRKGYLYVCTIKDFLNGIKENAAKHKGEVLHSRITSITEWQLLKNIS